MKKLLILLMALCCTSCTALPAEERAFAVALCVDKKTEAWQVYARIPTYKAGGEYLTVSGEGSTFDAALAELDASAPMSTALSQLRLLVLSDKLGKEDVSALLAALSARYELRQQCALAVTDASAKDVADALKPDTGARLSKAIDVLLEARTGQGIVPKVCLSDVLRMGRRQTPLLMRLALQDGKLDLSGAYPLTGDGDILAPLTAADATLLALLRGDTKTCQLSVAGGHVHVRDGCAKVQLKKDGNTACVTLSMQALDPGLAPDILEQTIADACVQLLSRLSGAGCDVLGLGRRAVLRNADLSDWPERLRQIRWEVSVQVGSPA